MLQNTLSALLQSVASRYAELSPSDVGIGLRGGRLVVDDVQLRAATFNAPHIPFHVLKGRAGRLRVNVPWSALTAAPVEVYLENVHLIAGPKHDNVPPKLTNRSNKAKHKPHWHQTNVGRLLFNVSVEMFGIKVEYRDDQCVGIISVASLHAFSAGPDWQRRFVSLTSVLDPNTPQATAVTMRKLLRLSGVHWVMIPRSPNSTHSHSPESPDHPLPSPTYEHRGIDLHSFESHAPILDGIPITVKVLLCSGTALVDNTSTPGLHAEIHVDIEDPTINLTARQIRWIDYIVKAGFGLGHKTTNAHSNPSTPKRTRAQPPQHPNTTSAPPRDDPSNGHQTDTSEPDDSASLPDDMSISSRLEKELAHQLHASQPHHTRFPTSHPDAEYTHTTQPKSPTYDHDQQHSHYDSNDEYDEEDDLIIVRESNSSLDIDEPPPRRGALSSFWQAIVSENVDDTVDDAAYALGLSNDRPPQEEDVDINPDVEEGDQAESQFAREAVNAAAMAGGLTMKLVLKTPDHEAWDKVEKLQEELEEEKKVRVRLQDAEKVLQSAEQRVQQAEALIQRLRDRNEALVNELRDLENMTSQAGRNKDAMIRQMEAALAKAERNLQGMLQAKFEQEANKTNTKSIQVNTYEDGRVAEPSSQEQAHVADLVPEAKEVHVNSLENAGNEQAQPQHKLEAANQVDTEAEVKGQLTDNNSSAIPDSGEQAQDTLPETVQERLQDEQLTKGDTSPGPVVTEDAGVATNGTEALQPVLTEIQLGTDRFRQIPEVNAPSVSISKLIADMSSKVEVSQSSRDKRLEDAMSSEGLTLI